MHLNLIILTDFHSFTVNEENSKNSQFSSFLLRSRYVILVKIWKWLKLLNSVPFIKKGLLNHVYIRIWSSWLTFTVSQGMKANIKISQFFEISANVRVSDCHFQILTWIGYSDLSRNLENWLILMFAFIPCETVKVNEDYQIRI